MSRYMRVAGTMMLVLVAATPAPGHHGWSQYDDSQTLTLVGVVREATFEHPHAVLRLEAAARVWTVILPPPPRAARLGLTARTLRAGQTVTVVVHPHRVTPDEVRALRLTVGETTISLR
ncbi:MAG: DUF6152 family protein [Armatimonadota bacterium]|nr:DUF6152 family protein [Armatimonadota bacterium]MDR7405101.1 DUF6152 family protein [Armatimonadota bacterium]